jgi:CBS domain containing-hemolysin-like protein
MTPRVDIDWIDADDRHEAILRTIRMSPRGSFWSAAAVSTSRSA